MTESEWLCCADPQPMLAFVRDRVSDRKLRLFAVACSRRNWSQLDDLARAAIEVAEAFADGQAHADALRAARLACRAALHNAAWYSAASSPAVAARNAALSAVAGAGTEAVAESQAQADLLRDVIGNPFQPVELSRSSINADVIELANVIYDERVIDRMPALAELLVAAGCDSFEAIVHCRSGGPHVRGCWLIDQLSLRS